jgi:outer membrane protein TolC
VLQAKKNLDTSGLNVKFAKNQILPSLTIQGTVGLAGLGKDPGDMLQRNLSGDYYTWGAGLVLSYPIGNRAAWTQYKGRQLEAKNAETLLEGVQQQVVVGVREAVRRVETDFKRIETARASRVLAARQLEAGLERLNAGLTITRFVLDFQRDLAVAQSNELRAIVDYNQALSNFYRNMATTLDRYSIELH